MRRFCILLVLFWLSLSAQPVPLVAAFPSPKGFINDFAGVLSEPSRNDLEATLRQTAETTSAKVVLVTVNSLDGMSVEEYAVRLFEQWGIGKKATDNGVLVLVVPSERVMRIEVGYGLEPVLPDGLAGEIIRTSFLPAFKEGDYARGIREGIARVIEVVRKGEVAPSQSTESSGEAPLWFVIPFLGLFVALGSFAVGLGIRSRTVAPLLFGGLFAGIPIFIALIFSPALIPLGAVAAGMVMWGYSKGASRFWIRTLRESSSEDAPDGWVMGGNSSSGSSGNNSASGSSFGGGSSGGGGATGRW